MITVIRKNQQTLLIIISVLVIIAFVWLYDRTDLDKIGADRVGEIYDRTVTLTDVDRAQRMFSLAQELGLFDLLVTLTGGAGATQDGMIGEFLINRIILQHEAGVLGIVVTDDEIEELIQSLPAFQSNGRFDPMLFAAFMQEGLAPRGFTERAMEEIVADQIRLDHLRNLVEATVPMPDSEIESLYRQSHQEIRLALIEIAGDRLDVEPEITDEMIETYYEENRGNLTTAERRQVAYVVLSLDEEEKALEGRERVAALQRIANQANDFTVAMLEEEASFQATAERFGVEVKATGLFSQEEPDPEISGVRGFSATAFSLSPNDPDSDPLRVDDSFYILRLLEVEPPRPLELEEARDRIAAILREEALQEYAVTEGEATRQAILDELPEGRSLREVVQGRGHRLLEPPPFSFAEGGEAVPHLSRIADRLMELPEGGLSPLIRTPEGALLVYVRSRSEPDDLFLDQELDFFAMQYGSFKSRAVFYEWLMDRRARANVVGL